MLMSSYIFLIIGYLIVTNMLRSEVATDVIWSQSHQTF